VVIVAIALGSFALWRYNRPTSTKISEIKSIAVLPLKSFTQSSEDEELRLRITDALITKLGALNRISVRLGDKERAFEYIEKHSPRRGSGWTHLKVDPNLDELRNEPRFQAILKK
jgi:hypothetical protein